jgi:regulation of enolase protein 1 (concanavalin A-like superfamily)
VYPAGSSVASGDALLVTASGADIWGSADAFRMTDRVVTGDFDVTARVVNVDAVDEWTKAGVMVRASVDAGSAHASLFATPGVVNGTAFQRRVSTDATSVHTAGPAIAPPVWVRLSRRGDAVTASYRVSASDAWTVIGSDSVNLPASVLVGVAVTSHQDGLLATAVFDNVTIVPEP